MATQQILLGLGGVSAVEVNASSTTNVVLATVFGSDWGSDVEKIYNVPSGVTTVSYTHLTLPTNACV